MTKIIPNAFQCPNFFVDRLAYFLTPQENVVLIRAVREILGWQDSIESRTGTIALSVFVEGKFKVRKSRTEENRLALGCGLGVHAVRRALRALVRYGVLIKGPVTPKGQTYTLQTDPDKIDWPGLEARRAKWDEANKRRTRKATHASLASRGYEGVTCDVTPNVGRKGVTSDVTEGVTSDVTEGVTSDVNKENHRKPYLKQQQQPGERASGVVVADLHLNVQKQAVQALRAVGVVGANELVAEHDAGRILRVLEYARAEHDAGKVRDLAAFVVHLVRSGEEPPHVCVVPDPTAGLPVYR